MVVNPGPPPSTDGALPELSGILCAATGSSSLRCTRDIRSQTQPWSSIERRVQDLAYRSLADWKALIEALVFQSTGMWSRMASQKLRTVSRLGAAAYDNLLVVFVWQGWRELNPRHEVLETPALPLSYTPVIWCTELGLNQRHHGFHPCALPAELPVRVVSGGLSNPGAAASTRS